MNRKAGRHKCVTSGAAAHQNSAGGRLLLNVSAGGAPWLPDSYPALSPRLSLLGRTTEERGTYFRRAFELIPRLCFRGFHIASTLFHSSRNIIKRFLKVSILACGYYVFLSSVRANLILFFKLHVGNYLFL